MKIRFATLAAVALGTVVIAGCIETGQKHDDGVPASPPAAVSCTDHDHDGWGDGCANGHDCNDTDPTVHAGCLHCAVPAEGCACKTGDKPQQCAAPQTQTEDGQIMCNEGTRYCRNGAWSGCEDIYTYPKPDPDSQQSVIDYTGTPIHCSDCAINCYLIHDNLDPIDGGLGNDGDNATINDGGGLSLQTTTPIDVDNYVFDPNTCMLGTAPDRDCDGIQDKYDPYPDQKPFATANPTLFLDVDPGETRSGSIDVSFFLNSADVYFLVDQSGSMAGEAAQLKTDLTTGDFINDSSYDCADYDFDFMPNNELKAQGVIGAVRCLIRDASFGVGLFREIPFSSYAPEDQIVFRNYTDVYSNAYLTMGTPDPKKNIDAAIAGIAQFYTDGNNDWPEADMLALNTLVTGNGMYFGITRPNIPARTTCPAGTWGYPCFRDGAIPIVVMFTDAMMHNGPSSNNYPYSSSALGMTKGTSTTITEIDDHNETFGSAENLTDLTSSYITVQGDTTNMTSDLSYATVTCGSSTSTGGHDALFKFIISGSTNKTVKLTTEGSEFDTTVSLFKGSLASSTTVATGVATNDTNAGAYSLGDNWNKYQRVTGDTSTLAADYSANDLGCGSSPQGKDSVFTFTLSQPTLVALDTANSGFGTVVGIYSGAPKVPSTTTTLPNTNDGFAAAYSVGDLYNNYLAFNGDTSAAGITANQSGGIIGCSTADASPDANYSFTLSQATRVRLSAEESTTFKPVIALTTAGTALPTLTAINNTNDTAATAYDIGDMANKVYQYVGDNSPLAADYPNATTGCNAADSGKDAVFKFTISGSGTKTLNIDTDGSAIDTVLSLYKGTVSSDSIPVVLTSNTNETGSTAQNLGVVDNAKYVVTGGSTAAMTANYTNTQIGCNSTTTTGDAAFKFHVNTARTVRLDTVGTAWDTVLSLHTPSLPDANVTTLLVNNKESLSDPYIIPTAVDSTHQQYNGNTSAMTADVGIDDSAGCSADTSAADAVYKFTVNTAGTYEINTIGSSFNTVLGLFPSNPTYAAPSGPYAKDKSGENKTGSTRPASSASLGDGRTGSTAINMTTTVGGWVVASANITTDATIDPSPQGTDLTTSSVMPMGGTAENAASPQSLGTVVQKLVTVSDSFTSTTNDHSNTTAWSTCSDATAKTGAGFDRVYSFTPTSSGTVRATMKSSNATATSYTLGVFTGSPALTSADWKDASNFSPPTLAAWPSVTLDSTTCPSTTDIIINTAGTTSATIFPNWCSGVSTPAFETQTQTSFNSVAPSVMVFSFTGLTLGAGRTLRVVGNKPAIFAVFGSAAINGTIDASYYNSTYPNGAGSTIACTNGGLGNAGTNDSSGGAGGGSGGSYKGVGGAGGTGNGGSTAGGAAGTSEKNALLQPLRAGCAGGKGGNGSGIGGLGGTGGGAIQLTVTGTLSGSGTIKANGSGGLPGDQNKEGGGGGGSGGAILVEYGANTGTIAMYANGGGGGGGSSGSNVGGTGSIGTSSDTSGAAGGAAGGTTAGAGGTGGYIGAASGNGTVGGGGSSRGGGGGGGGVGYIKTRALGAATWTTSNITGVTFSSTVSDVIVPSTCTITITTIATTNNSTQPTITTGGTGCPSLPTAQFIHPSAAAAGDYVVVFPISGSLWVKSGATITLRGSVANSAPVVFAVQGSTQIDGTIDASSSKAATYGAGAVPSSCSSTGNGGTGTPGTANDNIGDPGGGGAGGKEAGRLGGSGTGASAAAGTAGAAWNTTTTPLKGGCSGGAAKNAGGYGGGAVQISTKGSLLVSSSGVIKAGAGGGKAGTTATGEDGGGGGGSGGAIRLETRSYGLLETGAATYANGGGGGGACSTSSCTGATDGADGTTTTAATGGTAVSGGGSSGIGGLSAVNAAGTQGGAGGAGTAGGGAGGGGGGAGGIVVTSGFSGGNNGSSTTTATYDFTSAASYCTTGTNTVAGTQQEWNVTANTTYYLVAKETVPADADSFTIDLQWADSDWPGYSEDRYADDVYQQFSFTGSGTRSFTIDTQNTGFNAVLAVFRDDGTANVTSDDTNIGYAYANVSGYSSITATLTAGQTYYAIVKPLSGASLTNGLVNLGIRDDATSGPISVGSVDTAWTTYTGDTTYMSDDSDFSGCNADPTSNDAFYKFTVTSPSKSITIDMSSTTWDVVMGVYKWDDTFVGCDRDTGANDTATYTHTYTEAGDYYLVIKGHAATDKGAYSLSIKDNGWLSNMLECNDDGGGGTASSITRTLAASTYYAVVKGKLATDKGSYSLAVKDVTWANTANRTTCNDDDTGVSTSKIQQNLAAGDYYAVVKGHNSSDSGAYTLTVQDITSPPTNSRVSCNDDHGSVNTSKLTPVLDAGTYYLTVKSKSASAAGYYKLNISDASVAQASVLTCDSASGTNSTSLIETDLAAGSYNVIVKGKSSADKGPYKLMMRDLTNQPTGLLQCDHASGSAGKSYLEQDLAAGTYSVLVKGDAAASSGAYELTVRDANNIAISTAAIGCDDDSGYGTQSVLTKSLAPGTYYAAVKGHSTSDMGRYQLSVGGATPTSSTYVPPTWSQTLAALQAKDVRVMTVLSCHDDPSHGDTQGDCNSTRAQATTLANETDALGYNLMPLVFDIDGDGGGLSKTVVDGVAALAKYLEMDVGLRVVFEPDANPGFVLSVTPVDSAGDGCAGISASDHKQCVPGASPKFNLSFTNPLAHPVPLNPNDPNGGYYFRAELIGNNQFIVDQVPIYIVPKNITHTTLPPTIMPMGTYWQSIPSPGCDGNTRPDWRDLSWNADVPDGTKVDFKVCTVDDMADFATCVYSTICTVTGGAACTSDADCDTASGAYCADSGNCQTITAGMCVSDMDCPVDATCVNGACTFTAQPVLIRAALPEGANYKAYLRMQLDLYANTTTNMGPTVHDWTLTYLCNNQL